MDTIKREHWIDIKQREPEQGLICLVTDGDDVTVATWDGSREWERWNPVGVHGYEWDFDIEVTHWMPLDVELPTVPK